MGKDFSEYESKFVYFFFYQVTVFQNSVCETTAISFGPQGVRKENCQTIMRHIDGVMQEGEISYREKCPQAVSSVFNLALIMPYLFREHVQNNLKTCLLAYSTVQPVL